uniref:Uncharacterized protein n=1 Tax=Anopheles quadriannulatus TaxID=34691 RepID=A0A182XPD1_ANOQN
MCNFCREPHRRQRGTALHGIVRLGLGELMKVRPRRTPHVPGATDWVPLPDPSGTSIKTILHHLPADEFPGGVSAAVDSLCAEVQQKLDIFVDEYVASLDEH